MLDAALIRRSENGSYSADQYAAAIKKNYFQNEYSVDSVVVTLSIAIALYNSMEMILLIVSTFKRWKGLYFWSLNICNTGVILYSLGMLLMYFQKGPLLFSKIILDIGWWSMVVFQSLVLYSRLGLLLSSSKMLAAIKWMIIFTGTFLCTVVIIFDFGNSYTTTESWDKGYYVIEQIQMTTFTLQELIISGVYVWKTITLLKVIERKNTRSMIWQLLFINVVIISMDIALVALQFLHYQLYQEGIKGFVYSVKLKLELNILSRLVDLVEGSTRERSMTLDVIDSSTIAGQAQASVKQEMSWPGTNVVDWLDVDKAKATSKIEESSSQQSAPSTQSAPRHSVSFNTSSPDEEEQDHDGITRVFSAQSRATARTSGRESDHLYADVLRSIK